jgi:hypothetical protein
MVTFGTSTAMGISVPRLIDFAPVRLRSARLNRVRAEAFSLMVFGHQNGLAVFADEIRVARANQRIDDPLERSTTDAATFLGQWNQHPARKGSAPDMDTQPGNLRADEHRRQFVGVAVIDLGPQRIHEGCFLHREIGLHFAAHDIGHDLPPARMPVATAL